MGGFFDPGIDPSRLHGVQAKNGAAQVQCKPVFAEVGVEYDHDVDACPAGQAHHHQARHLVGPGIVECHAFSDLSPGTQPEQR